MLLCAETPADRERAWAEFLDTYSRLLLNVARSLGGGHDDVMDRYTFMLEALERDDSRRLRGFVSDGRCTFATWLTVVARRLCLDHHRKRYGRLQSDEPEAIDRRRERRQLVDLVSDEVGMAMLEASAGEGPDQALERHETRALLAAALATLDSEDRLLLRLRFEDEVSVPAIARLLAEPSPFKVYRRIDRILSQLRRHLRLAGIPDLQSLARNFAQ
jgi:RNA polymerase sigma factor (sigma-70 family)